MITLHKHIIATVIADRYATTKYLFDFENEKYGASELKFEITIDPDSFISEFKADIDGELFIGKTKERETAVKEYKQAKQKNENAILISQPYKDIPNVFQVQTNVDGGSKVSLEITIEQYLKKTFNFNQLTIQILRNFEKYNIKTKYDYIGFSFNVCDKTGIYDICAPSSVESSDIVIDEQIKDQTKCRINGRMMNSSSQNELSIKYKIVGESKDSHILFDNKSNTFCHVILDIFRDQLAHSDMLIPRRVIFVIDKSGSMYGDKWRKTLSATITGLKKLRDEDRFNVILFNHGPDVLFEDEMVEANKKTIQKAIKYMKSVEAGGGTSFDKPLTQAVDMIKDDIQTKDEENDFFVNQIIFMTDGEVRNTKEVLLNTNKLNNLNGIDKYNKKISIFTFGVGQDGNDSGWIEDVNHSFLKSLAVNNNGFYKRIKQTNTDTKLTEYFNILSNPILLNTTIKYTDKNIEQLTGTNFNILYNGNDMIVAGKRECGVSGDDDMKQMQFSATITAISGKYDDDLNIKPMEMSKKLTMTVSIDANSKEGHANSNVERSWAYLKLQQLSKQRLIAPNDSEEKENESLGLELGLKYRFVTQWTSMIVVKKKQAAQNIQQQHQPRHYAMNADVEEKIIQKKNNAEAIAKDQSDIQIPNEYVCPITQQIMHDPVTAFDGFTYDRNTIQNYFKFHNKSPITGASADYIIVFPNHKLKAEIQKWYGKRLDMSEFNFRQWNVDTIILWISQIDNGRYNKYLDLLKKRLFEEQITGAELEMIDETDLHMWGIVNFKDRKDLVAEIKKLISKHGQSKTKTSEFLNERKEFEQNFENVKKEVQALNKKIDAEMNRDMKKYKTWNADQICRYVLSLEKQRFSKYLDALTVAFQEQQIKGEDLPEIKANDLYTMGIDNFKDRKSLAKYFKNLNTDEGDIYIATE
eukprot:419648_1